MNELNGTPLMMRQMAQQIRTLIEEKPASIAPRLRQLSNQLEQEADIQTVIAARRWQQGFAYKTSK